MEYFTGPKHARVKMRKVQSIWLTISGKLFFRPSLKVLDSIRTTTSMCANMISHTAKVLNWQSVSDTGLLQANSKLAGGLHIPALFANVWGIGSLVPESLWMQRYLSTSTSQSGETRVD